MTPDGRTQWQQCVVRKKEEKRKMPEEMRKKLRRSDECFALAKRLGELRERFSLGDACRVLGISKAYAAQLLPLLRLDPALLRYVHVPVPPVNSNMFPASGGTQRSSGRLTWGVGLLVARLPREHQHAVAMTILGERLSEQKARRLVSAYCEKHGISVRRGNPAEGAALRRLERASSHVECLLSEHIEHIPLIAHEASEASPERLHALRHTLRMIELHAAALRSAVNEATEATSPPARRHVAAA